MEFIRDDYICETKIKKPLHIIIIGAGIGGLTAAIGLSQAGHRVTVLEQSKEISEVGAGINIPPNASRILNRFSVLSAIMKSATCLDGCSIRRYETNEELATVPFMPKVGQDCGAPLAVIHRKDLQKCLLDAIKRTGTTIRTGAKVTTIDPSFKASVQINGIQWLSGDVLIAADGIKSSTRTQMLSTRDNKHHSTPTGDAAYRIQIPRDKLLADPEALEILDNSTGVRWMGPDGHVMAYPICCHTVLNLVLLFTDRSETAKEESWTRKGSKKQMLATYSGYCPLVKRLMSYVSEEDVLEWILNSHNHLPTWVTNQVVLLGDACHPMLPYVAQGAANAIEDAGVLTVALTLTQDVPLALRVYEICRKDRAEAIQDSAVQTRKALHLHDGEEQEKRDRLLKNLNDSGSSPDLWTDKQWQRYMWNVDVMKETLERWDALVAQAEGHSAA